MKLNDQWLAHGNMLPHRHMPAPLTMMSYTGRRCGSDNVTRQAKDDTQTPERQP